MSTTLPTTHTEAEALYKKAGKVLSKPKKIDPNPNHVKVDVTRSKTNSRRVGVMSVTKAENAQLGLLLKYIYTNDDVYNSLPTDVLRYPEALNKLAGRYS